ncbi:MAG TPA: hypothetical protein VK661_06995 [Planctomycetota bacterium]|nr:hypothetical protein [Planctomycetota bacterium]
MANSREQAEPMVADDLVIHKPIRREMGGGRWVEGSLKGHQFAALVFPDHAADPGYELGDSRISKLWVQRLSDQKTVFNWDRGFDVAAENETVEAIVDFLAAGIADHAYEV